MNKRKQCTKCLKTKTKSVSFAKHIRYADGYLSWCKSCVSANKKVWKENNLERVNEANRIYLKSDARKAWRKQYRKKNISSVLADRMRARIYCFMKSRGIRKKKPSIELLGCTWHELRAHLESKFKEGMNWANYGNKWHVDHIIPMARFKEDLEKSCHYSNLQPLWAEENWKKAAKY